MTPNIAYRCLLRWLVLPCAGLLGQGLLLAQISCPPAAPVLSAEQIAQDPKGAPNRGLLWRVEKGGLTSWLYGTAHIARAEWGVPGLAIVQALQQSDALAVEVNMLDAESLKPLSQALRPASTQRVLSGGRGERLARQTALACLPPDALDSLRPALRAATVQILLARHDGFHAEFSIDVGLIGAAQAMKKPIIALELAQDQLDLLAGRNDEEEQTILDGALDELESGKGRVQNMLMLQAWAAADIDKLSDFPSWCECMDTPDERAYMKRMVDDRNAAMADKIASRHEAGQRLFVGVGALHMVGAQGMPALMRAKGYLVEQVVPPVKQYGSEPVRQVR